jgi:hypothetical protein
MDLSPEDWDRLTDLRARFLATEDPDTTGTPAEYWSSRHDLELYDATFAQRIGWKWRAVLREIEARGARPEPATLVDWASGTGIAARTWLAAFGAGAATAVVVHDRSRAAEQLALERLRAEHPEVAARAGEPELGPGAPPVILLVSHVLNELGDAEVEELVRAVRASAFVVWVEAGNRTTSRRLSTIRDALLEAGSELEVVAPCTHQARCGMLDPENERNWCHHFAVPPPEAFTSRHWTLFAKRLRIDLRALPYQFLVLRRGPRASDDPAVGRVLGRPRVGKGHVRLDWCDHAGVRELRLLERTAPELVRAWKKSTVERPLVRATIEGAMVSALEPALEDRPTGGARDAVPHAP